MPIPDFEALMLPVLRLTGDGNEHTSTEMRERIAKQLKLSEGELAEHYASGSQPVFSHRVRWAVQYLKEAAALQWVRRGVYKITDRGLSLLQEGLPEITTGTLQRFPEFVDFRRGATVSQEASSAAQPTEGRDTPEELMEKGYKIFHGILVNDLLERIKSDQSEPKRVGPDAFEQLVVDLLRAMYGGTGTRVGKAGDEGIDGIITRDKLGLDVMYVQAKKWKDATVGRPEIMKSAGALAKKHANRGVFITASEFTAEARQYVEGLEQKIALIDGRQLAQLMIEYYVGVTDMSPPRTYQLKQLDETYFENL